MQYSVFVIVTRFKLVSCLMRLAKGSMESADNNRDKGQPCLVPLLM